MSLLDKLLVLGFSDDENGLYSILYQKVLNAKVEATISNPYSADEVYMVARSIDV